MLIKMLSEPDKKHFLDLADLLIMADKPLLWEGKTADELTSNTDLDKLTIMESDHDRELIAELESSAGVERSGGGFFGLTTSQLKRELEAGAKWSRDKEPLKDRLHKHIMDQLIEVLKTFPLIRMEKPETRIQAATSVLAGLIENKTYDSPSTSKIVLFELLLVALRDGIITDTEVALLKAYQRHYQVDDFLYDELMERAEVLNQEITKTISIVLE